MAKLFPTLAITGFISALIFRCQSSRRWTHLIFPGCGPGLLVILSPTPGCVGLFLCRGTFGLIFGMYPGCWGWVLISNSNGNVGWWITSANMSLSIIRFSSNLGRSFHCPNTKSWLKSTLLKKNCLSQIIAHSIWQHTVMLYVSWIACMLGLSRIFLIFNSFW